MQRESAPFVIRDQIFPGKLQIPVMARAGQPIPSPVQVKKRDKSRVRLWVSVDLGEPALKFCRMGIRVLAVRLPDKGHLPRASTGPMRTNERVLSTNKVKIAGLQNFIKF